MSAAAQGAAVRNPGNPATIRNKLHWLVPAIFLAASFSVCLFCLYEFRQQAHARADLQARIKRIDRQQNLIDKFHPAFTFMQADQQDIPPAHIRWAERLQTGLAGLQPAMVKFQIEDPEPIQTDLPDLAREATVFQYSVRIDTSLADDAQLMDLLGMLSGLQTELFENRGCSIKKQRAGSALQLNCLYSIYDIELGSDVSQ